MTRARMGFWYRAGWCFFRTLYAVYFRWRVYGADEVPASGPLILAANHASFLDPPLVGAGLRRLLIMLARRSLFRFPTASSSRAGPGWGSSFSNHRRPSSPSGSGALTKPTAAEHASPAPRE
jgi:1-acyl-sn-glycerol-3-phosphate acyltransferase